MANRMLIYEKERRCDKGCVYLGYGICKKYDKPLRYRNSNKTGREIPLKVAKCRSGGGKRK